MNIFKKLLYFILGVFATLGGLSLMTLAAYIKELRDDNNAWKEYSKRHKYNHYQTKEEE